MNAKCDLCENEATVHEVSLRAGVRIERHLCESCAASAGITPPPSELPPILGLLQNLMLGQGDPDIQGIFPPVVGPTPPKSPAKPASQSPSQPVQDSGTAKPSIPHASNPPISPATPTPAASTPADLPLSSSPAPQVPKVPARHTTMSGKSHVCNTCKLTFADFKQSGLLGCADCYKYFEAFLGPLIQRAQDGGITHVGKKPRRLQALNSPESSSSLPAPSSASSSLQAASPNPVPNQADSDLATQWLQAHKARLLELRGMLSHVIKTEQYEIAARIRDELARITLDIQRVETQGHTPWLQKSESKDKPSTGDAPA